MVNLQEYQELILFGIVAVAMAMLVGLGKLVLNLVSQKGALRSWETLLLPTILGLIVMGASMAPELVDRSVNRVIPGGTEGVAVDSGTRKFHDSLIVCDMHADSLLWSNRNLLLRGSHGHVDVVRMKEGGLNLQAFTIVTKTPLLLNFDANANNTDSLTLLNTLQGNGLKSVVSREPLLERALGQSQRLHDLADRSDGEFRLIKDKKSLDKFLQDRQQGSQAVAGFLGVEGMHCLHGNISNVDKLFEHGIRMMAPVHFFDNELGGSAHGIEKYGLTEFGKQVIQRMGELNMILDIAHSSEALIDDILVTAKRPILTSHTGVYGTCANSRNLKDKHLKGIAKSGGVVSIAFFEKAVCGTTIHDIVRAIKYTVNLIGVDHVSLGSDFDGAVSTPFDATGFPLITAALLGQGFSKPDVAKIMGGNAVRVIRGLLP